MDRNEQIIRYNKEKVDTSKVDKKDLPYIDPIIFGLLNYNDVMPPLKVKFQDCDDHYKCIVRGWNQMMDLQTFCDTFANPRTRSITYDNIINVTVNLSDVDGQFVTVFRISKSKTDYHSGKKIKQ